ncbi:MAG: hypothetical protein IIZ93_06705, partial [Acidaminococcaceae bacterium]|nr:hypothetical protein [Acidaminococcaceae bacterium]
KYTGKSAQSDVGDAGVHVRACVRVWACCVRVSARIEYGETVRKGTGNAGCCRAFWGHCERAGFSTVILHRECG